VRPHGSPAGCPRSTWPCARRRAKEPTFSCPAFKPCRGASMATSSVAGAGRHDRARSRAAAAASSARARLGDRAGLVRLDQHAVARARLRPPARTRLGAGHEVRSSPTTCTRSPTARVRRPVPASASRQRVLDRHDGVALDPQAASVAQRRRCRALLVSAPAGSGRPGRTRGGDVQRDRHRARPARSRPLDRLHQRVRALPRCARSWATSHLRRPRRPARRAAGHQLAGGAVRPPPSSREPGRTRWRRWRSP
jgi:hypothetical protein